jgi:hypothetical protein
MSNLDDGWGFFRGLVEGMLFVIVADGTQANREGLMTSSPFLALNIPPNTKKWVLH